MNFYVMTLFPEMIERAMEESITGRAIREGKLTLRAVDIRDFAQNKHNRVDDYPYGGGAGMVMQAAPVYRCYESVCKEIAVRQRENAQKQDDGQAGDDCSMGNPPRVVYLTPQGRVFHQGMAKELAQEEDLIFLCGHYEGIDERVLQRIVTDYVSIGDYVLTGGELPALVMMDAISRMVPGVLGNGASAMEESFSGHLLEYPQYTRPEEWMGETVPPVLLSGHHANIAKWHREQSVLRTAKYRPDLLEYADLTPQEREHCEGILDRQACKGREND